MILLIKDEKTGYEYIVEPAIENYPLIDDNDYMAPYALADDIDRAVASLAMQRIKLANKWFKVGDRVAAYNHKGQREGKGTVIPSTDKRLLDYIKVELDGRGGFAAYYRADKCKRLVPKVKETDVHSNGE